MYTFLFIAQCYSAILGRANVRRLPMTKQKYWMLIIAFLIAVIVIGGIVAWQRYSPAQPVEISLPPNPEFQGEVYLGGAVSNPGFYPLESEDNIEDLIQTAGGTTDDADLTGLKLYVPRVGEEQPPQKIDINRAEAWLLEALPGIGPSKAQAIIDYRQQHGTFRSITEITNIEGIGPAIYEQIKHLFSINDDIVPELSDRFYIHRVAS
jgi:competence protein ComEA